MLCFSAQLNRQVVAFGASLSLCFLGAAQLEIDISQAYQSLGVEV